MDEAAGPTEGAEGGGGSRVHGVDVDAERVERLQVVGSGGSRGKKINYRRRKLYQVWGRQQQYGRKRGSYRGQCTRD